MDESLESTRLACVGSESLIHPVLSLGTSYCSLRAHRVAVEFGRSRCGLEIE